MGQLKTIAWDIDDVLNDLMLLWFEEKWLNDHPECGIQYEEIIDNPPHKILGVSLQEYQKSLDDYRLSICYQQMVPVNEIKNWFIKQGNNYRHIVITSVPLICAPASAQWVFKNFGVWIRSFHFVPSKRKNQHIPEYDKDKGSFLKWLGKADFFIDDNTENIKAAENAGVKSILIPRPWNGSQKTISESLMLIE
ncbi:hypothetical protein HY745_13270 [Candidatus Desantisbacteria bacterium]|nr:hypothetical protein [Candidatus Desantisbacteria bacterium]